MLHLNLTNKLCLIVGLHRSGKTYLAHTIAENYNSIFFTPHRDYKGNYDRYIATQTAEPQQEMEKFLEHFWNKFGKKYNMLIIDEAENYFPNIRTLLPYQAKLLAEHSHLPLAVIFVTHRPTNVNTTIHNMARYLFIFRLTGKTDKMFLDNIKSDLAEQVVNLPQYHFLIVDEFRNISKPVKV